jgi:hypothetical protein
MTSDQTPESPSGLANETAVLWNMPWHARLKSLADALRPGAAPGQGRAAESVHTWLERVRVTS